jgi:hypothetical protein
MATVTGNDEQNFTRRGPGSRFYEEEKQGLPRMFQDWFQSLIGSGAQQSGTDPRITGQYVPTGNTVTTGGGGRGSGTGAGRVTGGTPEGEIPRGIDLGRGGLLGGGTVDLTALRKNANRAAMYGPAAAVAVSEALQGRTLGAATGLVGGAAAGGVTSLLTQGMRTSKNPLVRAAGYALPAGASYLGTGVGDLSESAKAEGKLPGGVGKGQPTAGKEGSLAEQLGVQMKIDEQRFATDAKYAKAVIDMQNQLAEAAAARDLNTLRLQQPIIEQAKRNELVRNQALLATMGQQAAMLGTVATAGKLALGSQEEAGLNLRTALQANPYQHGVLAAPNITF